VKLLLLARERFGALVIFLSGGALLWIAAMLEPDPRGFGTHEQLGLPPCGFAVRTGLPCPTCGMTTAFAHFVRGHVAAAFQANPFGALAFLAVVVVTAIAALRLASGRPEPSPWSRLPWRFLRPAIVVAWLGSWGIAILRVLLAHGGVAAR
jgi:uncharacterized protein DUF2752